MKFTFVVITISVGIMMVLIFQAVRQELKLHNLKSRAAANTLELNKKEEVILQLKTEVKDLKTTLASNNLKVDDLRNKRTSAELKTNEFDQSLRTCNAEKVDVEKKKTSIKEDISNLKAKQQEAEDVARREIQSLKQLILDRDRAVCAFADTSKKEALDLCAIVGNSI